MDRNHKSVPADRGRSRDLTRCRPRHHPYNPEIYNDAVSWEISTRYKSDIFPAPSAALGTCKPARNPEEEGRVKRRVPPDPSQNWRQLRLVAPNRPPLAGQIPGNTPTPSAYVGRIGLSRGPVSTQVFVRRWSNPAGFRLKFFLIAPSPLRSSHPVEAIGHSERTGGAPRTWRHRTTFLQIHSCPIDP